MVRIKKILTTSAACLSLALSGCASAPVSVSFDVPKPWHDGENSYEKLTYSVNVYDTVNGVAQRVKIAEGALSYTLTEKNATGTIGYSTLESDFYVTYNSSAAEYERGLTDRISSTTEFQTESLVAKSASKKVELADRAGIDNLSYETTADYFGEHKATRLFTKKQGAQKETLDIPSGSYYDNEMIFHLARATAIGVEKSVPFFLTNIFDGFIAGEFFQYTMVAAGEKATATVELDKKFYDIAVRGDDAAAVIPGETYSVPCTVVKISISADESGQPYFAYFSDQPFKIGEKTHTKIPVKLMFAEYYGSKQTRLTEYILTDCEFDKQ